MRVFLAMFAHETNTFSTIATDRGQFEARDLRARAVLVESRALDLPERAAPDLPPRSTLSAVIAFMCMRHRLLAVPVLTALALLPPVAYTDPPDSVDVHGVYDPTDDATSNVLAGQAAVLCASPVARPLSLVVGRVAVPEAPEAPLLSATASDSRAPPRA